MVDPAHEVHDFSLPDGAEPPISVFVNGTKLRESVDFTLDGQILQFATPLRAQPPLGLGRKIMLAIGIGVYGDLRGDSLDVHHTLDGQQQILTDLRLRSTAEG